MLTSFDFDAALQAPFKMQPGLRALAPGVHQLTPIAPGSKHQREKLAVLSATPTHALACVPGFDATPALHALCAHAQNEHPLHLTWDGRRATALQLGVAVEDGRVVTTASGAFGLGDEVPRCLALLPDTWRLAGMMALTFAEDLAIVDGQSGTVPWMAVALPSRWTPQAKIGLHFTQIHAPVADNVVLLKAGEHLMRLVCGAVVYERFVWNVTGHPRLNAHPTVTADDPWLHHAFADTANPSAWFRSERQSFLPLPHLQQAVFAIGVDCQPLATVIDSPLRARRLHDVVASMSNDVLAYRGLVRVKSPLLAWLDARASA